MSVGEARHAADRYRRALRVIATTDQHPVSYSQGPKTFHGRYARIALEALDELEKIKPSTADALVEEFGSMAGEKPDAKLRKVATELLTMIDTVQMRRMPGMSASHGIYSPGSPMADKVKELRKLVNAEPAKS